MKSKKAYYIGLSIIILIFGLWVIKNLKYRYGHDMILNPDKLSGLKKTPHKDTDTAPAVDYIILNDHKAKAPDFHFINQDKDSIANTDFSGKVYVVEFFYTSCPTICPVMNQNLKEVAEVFKDHSDFGIASFTIDPKHDTPEVLKAYAERNKIQHPNWHFLTGDQDKIYTLAQEGFKLTVQEDQNEPGGILHDGMFALIDKDGYFRSRKDENGNPVLYYRGFIEKDAPYELGREEPQINELIEDIQTLLKE